MDTAQHFSRGIAQSWGPVVGCYLLAMLSTSPAIAQDTQSAPGLSYFAGIEELYAGDHRSANRIFRRELNQGVRVGTTRWVDSICYYVMQGEVLYQLGNNAEALAYFDQACQLFMQHPDWLMRVQFRNAPRADVNRARQNAPPWGVSERQATLGNLPDTMLVLLGRQTTAQEIQRRGPQLTPVEVPMFLKLQVQEIVRCTALAIRRRNEILGPLGEHDRISKDLVATLARGGLTQPNHWSSAWVELELGLAHIGVGNLAQAQTHLSRALTLDGQLDHSLTCVALLEQGRLALEAGNGPLAARLLAEASFSAFYYENWNVIDEALRLGQLNHIVMSAAGAYPPLEIAGQWARRQGLRLLATNFHIARAENLAVLGQTAAAAAALDEAGRWIGPMTAGRTGTQLLYVQALVAHQQGRNEAADELLASAVTRQAATSLRGFQLARTNLLFDGADIGRISSRVAVELYESLLGDPRANDWAHRPLDTLSMLSSPLTDSYDRWLLATLDRKDILKAIEISELAKRRQFHATLPWGGRLLTLRWLLEAPTVDMANDLVLERQRILADFPAYQQLTSEGTTIERQMAQLPLVTNDPQVHTQLTDLYKQWDQNVKAREDLLRQIGLSRQPAQMLFPPLVTGGGLQQALAEGKLILLFHSAGGEMHGFLLTNENYNHWRLGPARDLHNSVANLLRELGNYGSSHSLASEQLTNDGWRRSAHELHQQLFAGSRIQPEQISELVIIPDDVLWYLPFEALVPGEEEKSPPLVDLTRIRYAPTAGLAITDQRPFSRIQRSAIVAEQSAAQTRGEFLDAGLDRLAEVVEGPVRMPKQLPAAAPLVAARLEQLLSFDDVELDVNTPYDWSPLPRDRGRTGTLASLMNLPWAGPERVVLAGMSTVAESGLKGTSRRRGVQNARPGSELFDATCGLMAAGARTILLTRWRTSGETNLSLVREFAQEAPHVPAAEAWQRAVLVARDSPIDPNREPRLKPNQGAAAVQATADHPFFWAGYMLVDTGVDPAALDEVAADEEQPVVRFKEGDASDAD